MAQSTPFRPSLHQRVSIWRAALPHLRPDLGLMIGCALLVAFGVMLRANDLGHPAATTFDEHHFVPNARNLLEGKADSNDHPPLGKLLIATAIYLFGDTARFWRLAPLLAGLLAIAIAYRLAARLFQDERAGWIAAAFLAADGFFIAYSRTALLDGMLAMCMLAAGLFILDAKRTSDVAIASLLIGLAASIKFTGIVLVPALLLVIVVRHDKLRWGVLALPLIPAAYYAQYALGLHMSDQPAGPRAVFEATRALVEHHQALTDAANPLVSNWHTWFLPVRPMTLRFAQYDGGVRIMTTLGHPLLWWLVNVVVVLLLVRLPQRFVSAVAARATVSAPVAPGRFLGPAAPWAWLLLMWSLPILPWIISRRDSYIYHYLPAYGFGLLLAAGLAFAAYRRAPLLTLTALSLIGIVAAFYAPVWTQIPITRSAMLLRLPFEAWR